MLSNRATVGEHQPKQYRNRKAFAVGDPIPNYYPAVIEESLFQAAQEARRKNLASGRGRKGRLITNLFAGILTCAYCANPIRFHSNGNAKSLICSTVLAGQGCYRKAWSYRDFENAFLEFVKEHESSQAIDQRERETLAKLVSHIRALSGPDVYDARMAIAIGLRGSVSELKIASEGEVPIAGKPDARIRRDDPKRYFEIRFRGGAAYTGFPAGK
jgi:hypothetical protein